jgi:chromosome segregation ATPase
MTETDTAQNATTTVAAPTATATATTSASTNGSDQKPEKTFTQAELDAIIKERLAREKTASEKAQAEAAKKAADDAAAKNGEWQKLAEARAAEIAEASKKLGELESATARLAEYEATIKLQADAAKKDLPAHILSLLDALPPVKQLEWLAKNASVLGQRPTQTIPGTPPPASGKDVTEAEMKRRQQIEAARVRSYT